MELCRSHTRNRRWLDVDEEELQSTGRMMCESDFYDGESVTVVVDSKTGTGMIK